MRCCFGLAQGWHSWLRWVVVLVVVVVVVVVAIRCREVVVTRCCDIVRRGRRRVFDSVGVAVVLLWSWSVESWRSSPAVFNVVLFLNFLH